LASGPNSRRQMRVCGGDRGAWVCWREARSVAGSWVEVKECSG
jgi:hypothetical protein